MVIRRFGLGPWGSAGIAAGVIATAIAIVAVRSEARDSDLSLAFANPSGGSVALAQRILADGSWSGSGAGTFPALAPIYRDADDSTIEPAPPTAAAALVIEFGRPLLWLAVAAAAAAITMLFRAALRRGRDSFYPAAGAGCLVALVLLAFGNAGLFGSAISIVAATVLGVALAQSRSRSAQ